MVYYRVRPECDQKPRIKLKKSGRYAYKRVRDGIFVANELYTCGEIEKFDIPWDKLYDIVERVVIKKTEVYWFFGSRFEYGKGPTTYEG